MSGNPCWPSFPTDIAVESIDRAVELARHWQSSGRFNLFRGQAAPWTLVPSQLRIPDEEFLTASNRMGRLFRWILSSAGLSDINGNMDAILAVAQHYGLPTCLLDFTFDVDVAAFFAIHSKHQGMGAMACLVCLDRIQYLTAWNERRPKTIEPLRLIDDPVPDLWRLQAQRGAFWK
jgi:hypothetical protein